VHKHSNQPLPHLLQNVNYSRSACKWRQGRSKKKINRAAGGTWGWCSLSVAISGGDGGDGDGDGDSLSPVFSVFLCFLPLGSFSFFLSVCLPSPYLPFSLFFSFVFLLFFSVFLSLLPSSPFLFSFGLQPFFFWSLEPLCSLVLFFSSPPLVL